MNTNNSITVKTPTGSSKSINYDFLVITTGYKYSAPFKTDQNFSIALRKQEINSYYDKAAKAKKILVVGSGASGIE